MDMLFLGKLIPRNLKNEVLKKSNNVMANAANEFQWKIIDGLDKNLSKPVDIYNILPIGSYPKRYSDLFIKTSQFQHCIGSKDINVGFINLPYIKHLITGNFLIPLVLKWLKNKENNSVIIAYSLNLSLLKTIKCAKKFNPNITTCVIVPDMPEFNNLGSNLSVLNRFYLKYSGYKARKQLTYVDSFVFLTEQSASYLNIDKPYVIVEGISLEDKPNYIENNNRDITKTIVYTGTTHKQFGIMNLIEAFYGIVNKNYKLVICGSGDADNDIREYAKHDKRICFKGQVSHDEATEIQMSATVLVNPRLNEGEYTKYSFPSKTMEYLATGVPVIAYKLDGIPCEYDDYIIYVTDNTIDTLRDTLIKTCELTINERKLIGEKGQKFVATNKNSLVQTSKIINMIKTVINEQL